MEASTHCVFASSVESLRRRVDCEAQNQSLSSRWSSCEASSPKWSRNTVYRAGKSQTPLQAKASTKRSMDSQGRLGTPMVDIHDRTMKPYMDG